MPGIMIDHARQCIYVHIPKTAGNSVNRAFGISWDDHKDLRRLAGEIPAEAFGTYYKFAIVRNPWERLFSDYNYQRKKSRPVESKLFLFKASGEQRSFAEWVRAVFSDPHRYAPSQWGGDVSPDIHRWSPQVDWISMNGRIAVDRVLRLEQLNDHFAGVCRDLRMPAVRLRHRNRRFHLHYSWYYDKPTRELVAGYYAKDIAAFGYRFTSRGAGIRRLGRALWASLMPAPGLRTS